MPLGRENIFDYVRPLVVDVVLSPEEMSVCCECGSVCVSLSPCVSNWLVVYSCVCVSHWVWLNVNVCLSVYVGVSLSEGWCMVCVSVCVYNSLCAWGAKGFCSVQAGVLCVPVLYCVQCWDRDGGLCKTKVIILHKYAVRDEFNKSLSKSRSLSHPSISLSHQRESNISTHHPCIVKAKRVVVSCRFVLCY